MHPAETPIGCKTIRSLFSTKAIRHPRPLPRLWEPYLLVCQIWPAAAVCPPRRCGPNAPTAESDARWPPRERKVRMRHGPALHSLAPALAPQRLELGEEPNGRLVPTSTARLGGLGRLSHCPAEPAGRHRAGRADRRRRHTVCRTGPSRRNPRNGPVTRSVSLCLCQRSLRRRPDHEQATPTSQAAASPAHPSPRRPRPPPPSPSYRLPPSLPTTTAPPLRGGQQCCTPPSVQAEECCDNSDGYCRRRTPANASSAIWPTC